MKDLKLNRSTRDIVELHTLKSEAIRTRLDEFKKVPADKYFYELLYCILTPQSSAVHADKVVRKLEVMDFQNQDFNPEPILRNKTQYIRFHKTKSKYLLEMKHIYPKVLQILNDPLDTITVRSALVNLIKGFGLKEATHFLRNIGKNAGLAILDRHILRTLKRLGVIRIIPTSLTVRKYLEIEKRFKDFAEKINIPIDELDLLFWSLETGEIRK